MLATSLNAIAKRNDRRIQIVVVDDGSQPEHARSNAQLVREIAEHALYHHVDSAGARGGGPAFARNVGIKLSTGRIIAFCDDDDSWADVDHVSECLGLFSAEADLDLIFAHQEARHDGKVAIPKQTAKLPEPLCLDSRGSCFLSRENCLLGWFPHLNVSLFRRELLERIGGFWGTACFEDLDLYVRSVDVARKVRYLDRTVAIHNNATQREGVTAQLSPMDIKVCATNVASHLLHTVRSTPAIRYARRFAGDAYRWLAENAHLHRDHVRAAAFARLGLGAKFSPKWLAMTLYFSMLGEMAQRKALVIS
jgi:glycosyltransferase involved in cell wall biosynthesis